MEFLKRDDIFSRSDTVLIAILIAKKLLTPEHIKDQIGQSIGQGDFPTVKLLLACGANADDIDMRRVVCYDARPEGTLELLIAHFGVEKMRNARYDDGRTIMWRFPYMREAKRMRFYESGDYYVNLEHLIFVSNLGIEIDDRPRPAANPFIESLFTGLPTLFELVVYNLRMQELRDEIENARDLVKVAQETGDWESLLKIK